ncbi:MAG: hypothetical protein AAF363_19220 [Bacteroidota bacterium]
MLVKEVIESPAIEYKFEVIEKKDSLDRVLRNIECTITNITSKKSFENLKVDFLFDENSENEIFNPDVTVITPSSLHNIEFDELDNIIVEFKINKLQPTFQYKLRFSTLSSNGDEEFPKLFLTTEDTVRIIERSPQTWITKNITLINLILIVLWILLATIYLMKYGKINKKSN